jgi:hypothetical protein
MATIRCVDGTETLVDDDIAEAFGHLPWRATSRGYVFYQRCVEGQPECVFLHRLVGRPGPDHQVHHRDGNPLNNQRANLECLTPEEHATRHPRGVGVAPSGVRRRIGGKTRREKAMEQRIVKRVNRVASWFKYVERKKD